MAKEDPVVEEEEDERILLGLTQRQRYKIYAWGALAIVLGGIVWSLSYLRPWRWHTYTDDISVKKVARDVELGYVLWDEAQTVGGEIAEDNFVNQTVISSDGARMVYASNVDHNNTNLFLRLWDGNNWGEARPMRALNSKFHENSPALSGDGNLLYWNPTAIRLHGYQSEQQLQKPLEDFRHSFRFSRKGQVLPLEQWPMSRLLRGEAVTSEELEVQRIDTGQSWILSYSGEVLEAEVVSWTELNPTLVDYAALASSFYGVILVIVFGLAMFGVANTMLMATYERRREFAVMLAVGTTPRGVVLSVLYEALALGLAPDDRTRETLATSFANARAELEALDDPILAGVADPMGRFRVESVQSSLMQLEREIEATLGPALGVSMGLNSMDGD